MQRASDVEPVLLVSTYDEALWLWERKEKMGSFAYAREEVEDETKRVTCRAS